MKTALNRLALILGILGLAACGGPEESESSMDLGIREEALRRSDICVIGWEICMGMCGDGSSCGADCAATAERCILAP